MDQLSGILCWISLRWHHNGRDSVSNHQPHHCLLNRLFRRRWKKTSELRVTGLCAGNSPGTGESPHKWPATRKMFPFNDVIMCAWDLVHYLNYLLFNIWGCVFSNYPFPFSWVKISVHFIIITSEKWIISKCWRSGRETMVCAVCLIMFLWRHHASPPCNTE